MPAFGGPLLTTSQNGPQKQRLQSLKRSPAVEKTRKKGSLFGITKPGEESVQYSSSGEDDSEDEEATYAELGNKLTFEHKGTVLSLNTAADIAAWKKERSKNWPTRERMSEKEARRRQVGAERRRMLAESHEALRSQLANLVRGQQRGRGGPVRGTNARDKSCRDDAADDPSDEGATELQRTKKLLKEQSKLLSSLRASVTASEATKKALQAHLDEHHGIVAAGESAFPTEKATDASLSVHGDDSNANEPADESQHPPAVDTDMANNDMDHPVAEPPSTVDKIGTQSAIERQPPPPTSPSASSSSDSSDSDLDSDSDSDSDGPPEQSTSKPSAPTTSSPDSTIPLCRYYVASGSCRDDIHCRYRHELPARGSGTALAMEKERNRREQEKQQQRKEHKPFVVPVPGAKKSISERLVERQKEEEDVVALGVIKYLGEMGFFAAKNGGDASGA